MPRRLAKQLIYGVFYLLVLGAVSFVVYLLFFRTPASCTNGKQDSGEEGIDCGDVCSNVCLPANFQQIELIGNVSLFKPSAATIELAAKIQNGNFDLAAKSFNYSFDVTDAAGVKVDTISGTSFIYGGEVKYIIAIKTGVRYQAAGASFSVGNPVWAKAAAYVRPKMSGALNKQISVTSTTVVVSGAVADKDVISVTDTMITGLFYDQYGTLAGVSQTEIGALDPEMQKNFTLIHPAAANIVPEKTDIIITAQHP